MRKYSLLWIVLILLPHSALANEECPNGYWMPKGGVLPRVKAYDDFVNGLNKRTDWAQAANGYLRTSGLPITVGLPANGTEEYPDRLEGDDPSGTVAALFLKEMKLKAGSKLIFDQVVEVKSPTAKTPLMTWKVPYNSSMPIAAIDGDELLLRTDLSPLCSGTLSKTVWLAVKPSGELRVVPVRETRVFNILDNEKCTAHTIIKDSSYSTCGEAVDLMTRQKRILVFQNPMT